MYLPYSLAWPMTRYTRRLMEGLCLKLNLTIETKGDMMNHSTSVTTQIHIHSQIELYRILCSSDVLCVPTTNYYSQNFILFLL